MTLWDHLRCLGYGIESRFSGLSHYFRGHDLHWRQDVDLWVGATGDIMCHDCPNTIDGKSILCIWTRQWHWIAYCGMKLCGFLGHPKFAHPLLGGKTPMLDEVYCIRCTFSSKIDKEWGKNDCF